MSSPDIAKNLEVVRNQIAIAASDVGRDPLEIKLLAVSKVHTVESIRKAYDAGQRDFGENYVQELVTKAKELAGLEEIRWHFIGHLQTNKARNLAPVAHIMHTFDSMRIAKEVGKRAQNAGTKIEALIQVNVASEEQKSGCSMDETAEICDFVEEQESLKLTGLMVIPPWDLDPEEVRPYFIALRELRDKLGGSKRLPELSMGMSYDYEVAIAEGATIVRVGTAIFGQRST